MIKYIIKNCDCNVTTENICAAKERLCKDISDCLLKRIIYEIKKEKIINCIIDGKEQVLRANYHMCDKVLELLEIEECE